MVKKEDEGEKDAEELSKELKQVSVSAFFERNRHLLGYDNPSKALLTVVKEACDNSLDATQEARILPEVDVKIKAISETRFLITVEDNGPGIPKEHLTRVFGSLLYGSKFHRLRQSLTGDEQILIKEKDILKRLPIGEFVDKFLDKNEEERDILKFNILTPSFDWQTYKYSYKPISWVIRHKRENEIIKIKTLLNKEIKVTGCHSLFTLDPNELKVKEVEARKLKVGDYVIAPKILPELNNIEDINILDYIDYKEIEKNWWYVYNVPDDLLNYVIINSQRIKKKTDKGRAYYRIKDKDGKDLDILEDSMIYNYKKNKFLPIQIVLRLGLKDKVKNCFIQTYQHGKKTKIPINWRLTPSLMRFLGLYVAEGHRHLRSIAFDFGQHESGLTNEAITTARELNLNTRKIIDTEKNKIRVIVFGGVISYLFERWCGKGAKNKKVPEFIFRTKKENRQHFLDGLYQGDGHRFKKKNQLTLTTVSHGLCLDINYLWLMQGVVALNHKKVVFMGLGKYPSTSYKVSIFGEDLNKSYVYSCYKVRKKYNSYRCIPNKFFRFSTSSKRELMVAEDFSFFRNAGLGFDKCAIVNKYFDIFNNIEMGVNYGYNEITSLSEKRVTKHILNNLVELGYLEEIEQGYYAKEKVKDLLTTISQLKQFANSDLCLLKIKDVEVIDKGYDFVYDLAIPECENFIGGNGIACHNSRGIQGIGISAAVLYSQLTTGKAVKVWSKTSKDKKMHFYEMHIDVHKNQAEIKREESLDTDKPHGVKIEIEIEARYQKGKQGVDEYLRETSITNPHLQLNYVNPDNEKIIFKRASNNLPREPEEIKPHPHGTELGVLIRMLKETKSRNLQSFLTTEFCRIGGGTAKEIITKALLSLDDKPQILMHDQAEKLYKSMQEAKVIAPPTDCLSPIGESDFLKSVQSEIKAEFYTSITRSPTVYRGYPFQIECALSHGGELDPDGTIKVMRFANRVPLLYQHSACAVTEAIKETNWRAYGLQQSTGNLPVGPVVLAVHIASVWVPFTSEAKEAIAHYPEIIKEIKLAVQECGRRLGIYIRKNVRAKEQREKANLFEKYIPELASSLSEITKQNKNKLIEALNKRLKKDLPLLIEINEEDKNKKIEGVVVQNKNEKQTTLK